MIQKFERDNSKLVLEPVHSLSWYRIGKKTNIIFILYVDLSICTLNRVYTSSNSGGFTGLRPKSVRVRLKIFFSGGRSPLSSDRSENFNFWPIDQLSQLYLTPIKSINSSKFSNPSKLSTLETFPIGIATLGPNIPSTQHSTLF